MDFLHLLESDCGWRLGAVELKKNGDFDIYSYYNALRGVFFFHFPLERYLGCEGLSEGFLFCLDGGMGKDTCWRESKKKRLYYSGLVLHVP